MTRGWRWGLYIWIFGLIACDPIGPGIDGGVEDVGMPADADTDGDGITDIDEGRSSGRDTDGDGQPDYLDNDSDGDGFSDAIEAGDSDASTAPVDSDSDGAPDFIDLDSDDNGWPDANETEGDVDGDGVSDRADRDDDGDGILDLEEIGDGMFPRDSDGDGMADFQDRDSDNDTIMDGHERTADTDSDGELDVFDLDSDADGIPDSEEAGDADLETLPIDTDDDGVPDFRDPDSDNDGLSDQRERELGSSPLLGDTDMDGVSDLIEDGAGTDVNDDTDNPRTRGDFVFVVPYMDVPEPARDTLRFSTSIQLADVYFLIDKTGSMSGEFESLSTAITTVIGRLTCDDSGVACSVDSDCAAMQICGPSSTCVEDPATSDCIPSIYTGFGYYGGSGNSYPIRNEQSITADASATQAAVARTSVGRYGADETLFQAAQCIAQPSDCPTSRMSGCTTTGLGCPGFRADAIRILVEITDERNEYSSSTYTAATAGAALLAQGITFVGVDADNANEGLSDLTAVATASDSFDSMARPLVYSGDGDEVVTAVTSAITEIANQRALRVTIEATDEPGDDGNALDFIERLELNTTSMDCTDLPLMTDADGEFLSVRPGVPLCWDVVAATNTTVPPELEPLVFRALLTVSGDGSPLDSRIVYFLVPPRIEIPSTPT